MDAEAMALIAYQMAQAGLIALAEAGLLTPDMVDVLADNIAQLTGDPPRVEASVVANVDPFLAELRERARRAARSG